MRSAALERRRDAALCILLFATALLYIASLPRDLGAADESIHLYQAKRLLHGDVMYRDLWNAITPGFMALMAALFAVFGTSIATARIGAAVLHGLAIVFLYLACRRLRVRPALAWLPGLAYLVVCQPAWPIASQHWLATTLSVALLWIAAGRRRPFLLGIAAGLMIAVTQQRGLPTAAGVFAWLVADHFLQKRWAPRDNPPALLRQVAALIAGGLAATLPLFAWMIAEAGFRPVWDSLVAFPMNNYGQIAKCEWGYNGIMTVRQARNTFPLLLEYLPLVLLPSAARLAVLLARRGDRDEAAGLTMLLALSLTSIPTIWYFPDYIHIAFIAPLFFAALAENAEAAARRLALPHGARRAVAWTATAALLVASGLRLQHVAQRLRAASPHSRETAFGRVDLAHEWNAQLYDRLRELLPTGGPLFAYPTVSDQYLMLDAINATSYGFLVPAFNPPQHTETALRQLEDVRPPYVVLLTRWLPVRPDDPIMAWLHQHYRPLEVTSPIDEIILRRNDASGADG